MNLEQIDTSTTAGKAEVMRLAAEGRRVVVAENDEDAPIWRDSSNPKWDWSIYDYAIISEAVGSEEVWMVFTPDFSPHTEEEAKRIADRYGGEVVRYIRADLAGEGK